MKFLLNEIKKYAHNKPYEFSRTLDISEIKERNSEVQSIELVDVDGNCIIDGDEFIFSFTVTGQMVLPCARTLEDVIYPFETKEIEVFTGAGHLTDEQIEEEVHMIQGDVIDLRPCVVESVLLAIPFRVYSDEDVLKNALVEGDGWELTTDDEQDEASNEETIDPRLKKLEQLLNQPSKDE
ncbi:MAG TPA: YceD family protein [Bacillota bacterium]|nr:YceD family protein [Bacillota bacterium]